MLVFFYIFLYAASLPRSQCCEKKIGQTCFSASLFAEEKIN